MNLRSLILILHRNNLTDFNGFAFELYYGVKEKQAMCLSTISAKVNNYPCSVKINIGRVRIHVLA